MFILQSQLLIMMKTLPLRIVCFRYGIGFDGKEAFSHPSGGFGNNTIIFVVDMSSFARADNKKKDILILDEGSTQRLDGTTLTA